MNEQHHDHDTSDLRDLLPAAEPTLTAAPAELVRWVARNASRLAPLGPGADPEAPLGDLEPLRDLVGDARVVALGENSHQIREFGLLRHRVLRYLVEELGFTAYAMEYGAAEGRAVDAWVRGGPGDLDGLLAPGGTAGGIHRLGLPAECRDTLRWLRRHNAAAPRPVRFLGCDIPSAGGSLAPVLDPVAAYLAAVDPGALRFLEAARQISEPIAGGTVMVPAYARLDLDEATQDRLTTALSRLLGRLTDLREVHVERAGRAAYETALSDVRAAVATDRAQRAMAEALAGAPDGAGFAARERYLADTPLEFLDRSAPGTRAVLVGHNAHIQRSTGPLGVATMGNLLARALGADYVPIALTGNGGETVENVPDRDHPAGMRWGRAAVPDAVPDSVEALFADVRDRPALVDARALRAYARRCGLPEPVRTRLDTAFLEVPALEAFDGILCVPDTTLSADLPK
ncbi:MULTISPECIES: erythromycin esterase family protein [Streptomyces]|uniref:erythromycin esterase family protein n=1 Tax=Streptomyces TaxID=1883 RepID=UPI00163D239F|nr:MULTISPECIES: erythromycin esterase family protein [Streptomyces]MBC2879157.1 erythromycin esterase family protein [Streptomyces sp. TYQ1024]UBI35358.1 erythromycin esterase family protein [Streptomyces mobaraensis]UKW27949.1 erythromycin esterase family protein [Streptomyces sp. TYQ1024]